MASIESYYLNRINELQMQIRESEEEVKRLKAQRNEMNDKVRSLKDEIRLLQEPGSYVGEVVKVMGKNKCLVKINPEGKFVVEID